MNKYKNLSKYNKWKYFGIKEEGFNPFLEVVSQFERSRKDLEMGRTVSHDRFLKSQEKDYLPRHIFTVSPPRSDSYRKVDFD